jgi:ABC-type transporter Mla MlaB component
MKQIILGESVSIDNIKDLYYQISDALDNESEVILDFSLLKNADISLRLVLISCFRRARKRNVELKMKNMTENIQRQIITNTETGGLDQWAGFLL